MGHSKFKLDVAAFEASSRQVIQPHHIKPLQDEAGVNTQLFQTPPGLPEPEKDQGEQVADAPENPALKCNSVDIDGFDARDRLYTFQESERNAFDINSESDCDVPEDELSDELEDTSSDQDQLVPVIWQLEEGQAIEGEHGQRSPENISVDNPATEEDQPDPVNVKEGEDLAEGNHDRPSRPGNVQLEDIIAVDEVQWIPVNLQEEDYGQPNPVIIPVVEDSIAIEGKETSPGNLRLTVVSIPGIEPEDSSTPRCMDVSIATFDGTVYPEADQKVIISENQLDVKVQTVTATSAAGGESSNSPNLILMDILYELCETVKGNSAELPNVNETATKTYN